jgi:Zn-dependent protease
MTNATAKPAPTKLGWLIPLIVAASVKFKSVLWIGGSLVTMFLSVWVFAQRDGFPYAIGLVLLIFIHESGHWIWMKALGLKPKAPMFIPGFGAFVAMTKMPASEALHAWTALAGPLIGGLGCAVLYSLGVHTNSSWLMTSSNIGFMLNLMQLIPAKPLDGGFVVNAMARWLLIPGTIALFLMAMATGASLLYVIAIVSLLSWKKPPAVSAKIDPTTGLAEPVQQSAPATGWEKVTIGIAYLTLIGALTWGLLISSAEVNP